MGTPENTALDRWRTLKTAYFAGDAATCAAGIAAWDAEAPDDPCLRHLKALVARYELALRTDWTADYDAGFACGVRTPLLTLDGDWWTGELTPGDTLIIWAEEGLGDFIRHARHIAAIMAQGLRVTLHAPTKMLPLLKTCLPACRVTDRLTDLKGHRWHIPSGSLDGLFWDAETNPQPSGYLRLPDASRPAPDDGVRPFNIGVCSRSLKLSEDRNPNYTALAALAPLFRDARWQCHSFQYRDDETELADANRSFANPVTLYPDRDFFDDPLALAQTLLGMDMVVATSTMVADLAGALGIKTWRFHARPDGGTTPGGDSRPVSEARSDRCWYGPSTTIWYRAPGQSWEDFFTRMAKGLEARSDQTMPAQETAPTGKVTP